MFNDVLISFPFPLLLLFQLPNRPINQHAPQANETLPLFLDRLVPSYVAVIMSVTLVLVFGEILPSAIFSGPNQLRIAARLANFVWFLMLVLAPLSYPLAWLLDRWFGQHNPRKVRSGLLCSALLWSGLGPFLLLDMNHASPPRLASSRLVIPRPIL